MKSSGYDITGKHMDCGLEIYDRGEQDVHSGGSGCGCSAVTLCAHILPKLMRGEWSRVLFVPTGALLSTVSYNEGQSIPESPMGDTGTDGGVKEMDSSMNEIIMELVRAFLVGGIICAMVQVLLDRTK